MAGIVTELRGVARAQAALRRKRRAAEASAVRKLIRPVLAKAMTRSRRRARERLAGDGVRVPARAIKSRLRRARGGDGFRATMFPARDWFYLRFLHFGTEERRTRKGARRGRVRSRPWYGFGDEDRRDIGRSALERIRTALDRA